MKSNFEFSYKLNPISSPYDEILLNKSFDHSMLKRIRFALIQKKTLKFCGFFSTSLNNM